MEAPKWCVLDRRFRPSLEVLQVAIYENEFHKTGILRIPVDGFEILPQSEKINYDNKRGIPVK
jgi:hypothetical protein